MRHLAIQIPSTYDVSVPDVVEREDPRGAESVNEILGELLRELRDQRGITQSQVADRAGISRGSVANIERGDQGASVPLFLRLVAALEADGPSVIEQLQERVDKIESLDGPNSELRDLLSERELRWVMKSVAESSK